MHDIQIEQIRFELTWRIRREAMYPDLAIDDVKLENDNQGIHFGLYANDVLTSVISLFQIGNVYQFRKFATLPSAQGKGYGTELLKYIIEYIKQMNGKKIWCNARKGAIAMYKKFGMSVTNESFQKNGIDFVVMELEFVKNN